METYTKENLNTINSLMEGVTQYGLEAEVIVGALGAMKNNPDLSIIEAFQQGCNEWDV